MEICLNRQPSTSLVEDMCLGENTCLRKFWECGLYNQVTFCKRDLIFIWDTPSSACFSLSSTNLRKERVSRGFSTEMKRQHGKRTQEERRWQWGQSTNVKRFRCYCLPKCCYHIQDKHQPMKKHQTRKKYRKSLAPVPFKIHWNLHSISLLLGYHDIQEVPVTRWHILG